MDTLSAIADETRLAALEAQTAALIVERDEFRNERDVYRKERDEYRALYLKMVELCKKLERGILDQKRERFSTNEAQLTLSILETMLGSAAAPVVAPEVAVVPAHKRQKPTGRKPLPEKLPRVDIEVVPPEVERAGLDAYERIGEDVTETVERRPSSLVVVRVHKPKFALKGRDRLDDTEILQATPPELPIERGLAGPGLLADTIVKRFQDHLPLHRLERIYGREGLELSRSTVCDWHQSLAALATSLIAAMWTDALTAPYLCTDATGVLVQAKERCTNGHFWTVIAPDKHVLFNFSERHDKAAVDEMLQGYEGYLVADAHAVYDHLFATGKVTEVGCWAHARRYFFKALDTDPTRAREALGLIGQLFRFERTHSTAPPEQRKLAREREAKPVVDAIFAFCLREAEKVLDETPIHKAIRYALNQREALTRFLEDGRLPLHNNWSERELRRQAVGRKNWLFVGSEEGGQTNATFVSLLASCQLHEIEPLAYLRDLLCLLPSWSKSKVLELAPAYWQKTLQQQDTQRRLADNIYRQAALGSLAPHQPNQ